MEIQLRDYRIRTGHMDDWIRAWQGGVAPIREQEGFVILGAWVDRPHHRFLWVVGYSGDDGFAAADERYYASPERLGLSPDPSSFIEEATADMVDAVTQGRGASG